MNANALLVALLVGFFGGVSNLLVDAPAIWNYDWRRGIPNYNELCHSPHRYLHDPFFCFYLSHFVNLVLTPLVDGLVG